MTTRKYSSRSQQTTLTSAVSSGVTILPVANATAVMGGATLTTGQTFTIVIDPDTALEEICEVTFVAGNNLTVTRAIDMAGATAQDHSSGAVIRHMIIGRDLREANLHIEATAAYNDGTGVHTLHGLTTSDGDIVGTDKTQSLTNKTLVSPTITGNPGIATSIVFEGSTTDANQTTFTVTDPTADRTITLPDATGTVVLKDTVDTLSNKTLGSALAAGTYKITGLGDPTSAQDAATKNYVDTGANSQVAAAATSATSAAASATAAATSATSAAASATAAATSATSAATTYTAYDVRYLGSKSSAPTLDNQGNALITGATYWNSTTNTMYAWSGSVWTAISTAAGAYTAPTLGSTVLTSGATISTVSGLSLVTPTIGNIKLGYTAVTASASTVILLNNSTYQFVVTGSTTQLFTLPVASTMTLGLGFKITNDSTANVTVQSSGANTVIVIPPTYGADITCVLTSGTTASSWTAGFSHFDAITGTGSVVAATSPTLTTPNLGIPSALVLTNATGTPTSIGLANGTGLPVSGITASTTTALGVGSIELGNATDTTLSRSSAGVLAVEGVVVDTVSAANTLTNKTLTTPVITQGTATPTFTTNAYALVLSDAGKLLLASNSTTAGTINIPTDASVAFATGTQIHILQTGTGQLTVSATTPGTTTVLSNGATAASPKMRVAYSTATLLKTAANTWYVFGDIV